MATPFTTIYNRFLGIVTDDEYLEMTKEETLRDLFNIFAQSLPDFEFPRFELYDYTFEQEQVNLADVQDQDVFFIWKDLEEGIGLIEKSHYNIDLTEEEINIIAVLMKHNWVNRQLNSIENTRMKYSGSDFKMTSQANHLSKLLSLANECLRDSIHKQRLYKRRRPVGTKGGYEPNWDIFREDSAIADQIWL